MNRFWRIILISIIGFLTFLRATIQSPIDSFSQPVYQLKVTPNSIHFLSSDLSEEIFRISPFDDYIYHNGGKSLIVNVDNFDKAITATTPVQQFVDLFLLKQDRFNWKALTKDGLGIEYEVINQSGNEVIITRELTSKSIEINSIGSSYMICSNCIVTDQKRRYFVNQEYLELGRVSSAQSIGLTPTILTESLLPADTETITILDSSYNSIMSIFLQDNTDIYYHQQWNIIELRNTGNTSTQRIYLY